ncbi:MAG TPA: hypothetical protein VGI80_03740 [Pyrinomonadaceae bacterium]
MLDFVPYYAERIPVVSQLWARSMRRRMERLGSTPNFARGYWEPPLEPREVLASETASLASLGLAAEVSITDHDSIEGARATGDDAPISMEWTVPFRNAFFHVGVHNMPPAEAVAITASLLNYTNAQGAPNDERLSEILEMLDEKRDVLVVLNHPIWDIEMIGQQAHERALSQFVAAHGHRIHAIEVNGFRSWNENLAVIQLAEELGKPIVSGGDRHCCQVNTMVNVSEAANFEEFVNEVRVDGQSTILVRSEYHAALPTRQLTSMNQILSRYGPGPRARWIDRIHIDAFGNGELITLSDYWEGKEPIWAKLALGMLRIMSSSVVSPIIAACVGDIDVGRNDEVGHFTAAGFTETPAVSSL